jgi:hypothetical protein
MTKILNSAIDYTVDAPHYDAWAGTGANATRIYDSGDQEAMTELRRRYNTAVTELVAQGTASADAMIIADVERIAGDIVTTHLR